MENLEIYLLGNARIERNETSIALGRRRAMGVIAYFLLANEQIITREVLLEQLWPGESDGQAELTSIIHTCKNLGLVKPLAEYDGQAAVEWVCNESVPTARDPPLSTQLRDARSRGSEHC